MSFRKPCHMPFRKLIPPFTLTEKLLCEHARKKLYADGEYFYYPHGICFRGLHRKKTILRWNDN